MIVLLFNVLLRSAESRTMRASVLDNKVVFLAVDQKCFFTPLYSHMKLV
jgi:hypothetical protein